MYNNGSKIRCSFRFAVLAATAAVALQASAVASPAPASAVATPFWASNFELDYPDWLSASRPFWPSSMRWSLDGAPTFATGPMAFPVAGAGLFNLASGLAPAPAPLDLDGFAPATRNPSSSFVRLDAAPSTRPMIDISMKPVAEGADPRDPRLQPTVYTRPVAPAVASASASFLQRPATAMRPEMGDAPNIFGSVALAAGHTPEDAKWRRVAEYVPTAAGGSWSPLLAHARRQPERAQLQAVNAWVNHAIAYTPDVANYGVADYWGTARESLTRGRGDCKDYAIAKMELLRALGVPADDLYLVLVKDLVRRQDHAVLAVRLEGRFVILDSGFDGLTDSEDVRDYRPILTFSGGRTWVHGFRRAPELIVASAATSRSVSYGSR